VIANLERQLEILTQAVQVKTRWDGLVAHAAPDDPIYSTTPIMVLPSDTHPLLRLLLRAGGFA